VSQTAQNPFAVILNLAGEALEGGKVYIGVANQNPRTNPQAAYWDAALTVPATQPLDVTAGYIYNSGSPAVAYTANAYSIAVDTAADVQVFYKASVDVDFLNPDTGMLRDGSNVDMVQAEKDTFRDYIQAADEDVYQVGGASPYNNFGIQGALSSGTLTVLGNSFRAGGGVGGIQSCMAWFEAMSVSNAFDMGIGADPGVGYPTFVNMTSFLEQPGVTSTGALSSNGFLSTNSRLTLSAGEDLAITQREASLAYVVVDMDNTTATDIRYILNGATIIDIPLSGSGLQSFSISLGLSSGQLPVGIEDDMTFRSIGGDLEIVTVQLTKVTPAAEVQVHVFAQGGFSFADYLTGDALDEVFFLTSLNDGAGSKCFLIDLMTNCMYNVGKSRTPSQMTSDLEDLTDAIVAEYPSAEFLIGVAIQADENIYPIIIPGYTYADYVEEMITYCKNKNFSTVRYDLTPVGRGGTGIYLADGLHPGPKGHLIYGAATAAALGLPYSIFFKGVPTTFNQYARAVRPGDGLVTMNSTWGPFGAASAFTARVHPIVGGIMLSGLIIPNGSTNPIVGTLPAGMRPVDVESYVVAATDVLGTPGTARLKIAQNGQISVLDAAIPVSLSLGGIFIPLNVIY